MCRLVEGRGLSDQQTRNSKGWTSPEGLSPKSIADGLTSADSSEEGHAHNEVDEVKGGGLSDMRGGIVRGAVWGRV